MNVNTCCKFVSHKVNKIRWLHISKDVLSELDTFVTGSWDDLVSYIIILLGTVNARDMIWVYTR